VTDLLYQAESGFTPQFAAVDLGEGAGYRHPASGHGKSKKSCKRTRQFGNIVPGVYAPVLARQSCSEKCVQRLARTGAYAPLLAKDSETEGPEVGLQEFRQIGTGKRPCSREYALGCEAVGSVVDRVAKLS